MVEVLQQMRVGQAVSHTLLNLEHYEYKTQQEYVERMKEEQRQTQQIIDHF